VRPLARIRALPGWAWPAAAGALLLAAIVLPALPLPRATVNALVVFDITQSMDVEDMSQDGLPASRLAFAKDAARRALRELPCGSRVGWGAFTEYRTLVLLAPIEVCANYADLVGTLANIDGRIRWGNASEVSKGVFWAMRASRQLEDHPAIVFVTDGQESPPLGSFTFPMFPDLKAGDVAGVLLGVGGPVPRPIPRSDADGQRVGTWRFEDVVQRDTAAGAARSHEQLSELREAHLRALATQTGLGYATAAGPDALALALADPRLARRQPTPTDLAWIPAGLALALLAWTHAPRRRGGPGIAGIRLSHVRPPPPGSTAPPAGNAERSVVSGRSAPATRSEETNADTTSTVKVTRTSS
jgi:mxaL protein